MQGKYNKSPKNLTSCAINIMYKRNNQIKFSDFVLLYRELDANNDWVMLSSLIPRDEIEKKYAKKFAANGHPAHNVRIALGSLKKI